MNESLTFRPMRADELTKWLDFLCTEIFPNDPRDAVESLWHSDAVQDPAGVLLALNADGNIIASVKAGCRALSVCGCDVMTGIISGVGVRRDFRTQGITSRLFALCDEYMRSKRAKLAHLFSKPDTLEFYLHNGYMALPQRPGEDFYRMYRVLMPFYLRTTTISETGHLMAFLYHSEEFHKRVAACADNPTPNDKTDL